MTDKRVGVNAEEATLTLMRLANYHAISIALVRQWRSAEGQIELPEKLLPSSRGTEKNVAYQEKMSEILLGSVMPVYVEYVVFSIILIT